MFGRLSLAIACVLVCGVCFAAAPLSVSVTLDGPTTGEPGDPLTYFADGTFSLDGATQTEVAALEASVEEQYAWEYAPGSCDSLPADSDEETFRFAAEGTRTITVTYTVIVNYADSSSDQAFATDSIVVEIEARELTVAIIEPETDPFDCAVDAPVEFEAEAYLDGVPLDSELVSWEWDFGDESDPDSDNPTAHTYAAVHLYHVTVTATYQEAQAQDGLWAQAQQGGEAPPAAILPLILARKDNRTAMGAEAYIYCGNGDTPCDAADMRYIIALVAKDPELEAHGISYAGFRDWDGMHEPAQGDPGFAGKTSITINGVTYDNTAYQLIGVRPWSAVYPYNEPLTHYAEIHTGPPEGPEVDYPRSLTVVLNNTVVHCPDKVLMWANGMEGVEQDTLVEATIAHLDQGSPVEPPPADPVLTHHGFDVGIGVYDLSGNRVRLEVVSAGRDEDAETGAVSWSVDWEWDGKNDDEEVLPAGIYTYSVTASCREHDAECSDQDKSPRLSVTVEDFYWFEKDPENGKLRGVVRYELTRAAAQCEIKFYDHELNYAGQVACSDLSAGEHFSEVYEIDVPYDQNDNLIQPVYCVAFATETAQDGALNRDGQPKPALPRGSSGLQEVSGSVSAEGAYSVPPDPLPEGADLDILHFVTPKGGANDVVTLTATIQPQGLEDFVEWEGATPDPENPLVATVPKGSANKHEVKLKVGGAVLTDIRVWVVWFAEYYDDGVFLQGVSTSKWGVRIGYRAQGKPGHVFCFEIRPTSIVTDPQRPLLTGAPEQVPPSVGGGQTGCWFNGQDLSAGAGFKWDTSRRIRMKFLNPDGVGEPWSVTEFGLSVWGSYPEWPQDPVVGNDDPHTYDEWCDMYTIDPLPFGDSLGRIWQIDEPVVTLNHSQGNVGDEVELRIQFEEFARLNIGYAWYVCSDGMPWRITVKARKVSEADIGADLNSDGDQDDEVWVDNGSSAAQDHIGW